MKNFSPGPKWKNAHIGSRTGPLSYTVKYGDGVATRRHVDHLLKRFATGGLDFILTCITIKRKTVGDCRSLACDEKVSLS